MIEKPWTDLIINLGLIMMALATMTILVSGLFIAGFLMGWWIT